MKCVLSHIDKWIIINDCHLIAVEIIYMKYMLLKDWEPKYKFRTYKLLVHLSAFNMKASHSRDFIFGTLVSPGDHKCSSFMEGL